MYQLLDGKLVSAAVKDSVKEEVEKLKEKGTEITLAVILVGNDPASRVYVNNKKKACEYVGFRSCEYTLDEDTTEEQLLDLISQLNSDSSINGILCQLPLPGHIDEKKIIKAIDIKKDVDAFCEENVGRIMIGNHDFLPCTPAGVMELIHYYDIPVDGKNAVVIGRSNIVGKPMAMLLLHENATVTITHSHTKDLENITSKADIIVAAVGIAKFLKKEMIKDGAVIIDVGMNRDENGKLCGDVDFEDVKDKCSFITPVPGGVGPMTISMLMKNTLKAYYIQNT